MSSSDVLLLPSGRLPRKKWKNIEDLSRFDISEDEKLSLDKVEGLGYGYEEKTVLITDGQGKGLEAFTYYATNTYPSLQPYSWYLHHVIFGAKETAVPASYLDAIKK